MKTASLEILEKAELPSAQAHAILKVMESEMSSLQDTLATKADLNGGLLVLRADLDKGLSALGKDLDTGLLTLRNDVNVGLASVRAEILTLAAEMARNDGKLSRWVLTCILGQTAFLAGLAYFLAGHWRR
jgi:hypothetical protein